MLYLILYIILIDKLILRIYCGSVSRSKLTFISHLNHKLPLKNSYNKEKTFAKTNEFNLPSTFEDWKYDMNTTVGVWSINLPYQTHKANGFYPIPSIKTIPMFLDDTGRVIGPNDIDTPLGSYLLDSKNLHHLVDENNFLHSRRLLIALKSGVKHSNLRIILAGRVFYSNQNLANDLGDDLKMVPALFLGQTFLESYDNLKFLDSMSRLKTRYTALDRNGNEVDPLIRTHQYLESKNSPFRWLHGNEKWKLVGPFTCYKSFDSPNHKSLKDPINIYKDSELYNVVDSQDDTWQKYTDRADLEDEVHLVVRKTFKNNTKLSNIKINNEEYLKLLEKELITLGDKGPDYYRKSFG